MKKIQQKESIHERMRQYLNLIYNFQKRNLVSVEDVRELDEELFEKAMSMEFLSLGPNKTIKVTQDGLDMYNI